MHASGRWTHPLSKTHLQAISRRWTARWLAGSPAKGPIRMQQLTNIHISALQAAASYSGGTANVEKLQDANERVLRKDKGEVARRIWASSVRVSVLSLLASIILREAKSNPHFRGSNTEARGLVTHTYNYSVYRFNAIFITSAYCSLTPCSSATPSLERKRAVFFRLNSNSEMQPAAKANKKNELSASFHFSCSQFALYTVKTQGTTLLVLWAISQLLICFSIKIYSCLLSFIFNLTLLTKSVTVYLGNNTNTTFLWLVGSNGRKKYRKLKYFLATFCDFRPILCKVGDPL